MVHCYSSVVMPDKHQTCNRAVGTCACAAVELFGPSSAPHLVAASSTTGGFKPSFVRKRNASMWASESTRRGLRVLLPQSLQTEWLECKLSEASAADRKPPSNGYFLSRVLVKSGALGWQRLKVEAICRRRHRICLQDWILTEGGGELEIECPDNLPPVLTVRVSATVVATGSDRDSAAQHPSRHVMLESMNVTGWPCSGFQPQRCERET